MNIDKDTFEKIIDELKRENGIVHDQHTINYISDMHSKKIKFSEDQLFQLIYTVTNRKKRQLFDDTHMTKLVCDMSKIYALTTKCVDLLLEYPQKYNYYFAWFDDQIIVHKYIPTKKQIKMLIDRSYKKSLKLILEIDNNVNADTLTDIIRNMSYDDADLLYCLQTFELSIPHNAYQYITHALSKEISTHIITKQEYSNDALKYIMLHYYVEPAGTYMNNYYDKCIQFNGNNVLSIVANINRYKIHHCNVVVNVKHMMNYIMPIIQHEITSEEFIKIYKDLLNNSGHYFKNTISLIMSTNICHSQYMEKFFSDVIYGRDIAVAEYIIDTYKNISEKCIECIVSADELKLISRVFNMKITPAQHIVKHIKSLEMFDIFVSHGLCVNSEVMSIMLKKNTNKFDILQYGYVYDLDMYNLYCMNNVFDKIKESKTQNAFRANIPDYELRHDIYSGTLDASVLDTQNMDCHMYGQLFKNYSKYENIILACEKKYKYVPTLKLAAYIKEPETREIIINKIKSAYENLPKELLL